MVLAVLACSPKSVLTEDFACSILANTSVWRRLTAAIQTSAQPDMYYNISRFGWMRPQCRKPWRDMSIIAGDVHNWL